MNPLTHQFLNDGSQSGRVNVSTTTTCRSRGRDDDNVSGIYVASTCSDLVDPDTQDLELAQPAFLSDGEQDPLPPEPEQFMVPMLYESTVIGYVVESGVSAGAKILDDVNSTLGLMNKNVYYQDQLIDPTVAYTITIDSFFVIAVYGVGGNKKTKSGMQRTTQITGRGDYKAVLSQLRAVVNKATKTTAQKAKPLIKEGLQAGGKALGSYLGSQIGMAKTGSMVGNNIAQRISRLIGSGDYAVSDEVHVNSLIPGPGMKNANAMFGNRSEGTRVRHREYIQDVYTASAGQFYNLSIPVNPGLSFFSPWTSNIAQNYEQYRVTGLVFEYISSTSPYNSNSAIGTVIMAMEYNAASAAFTNKPQMENSDFAISARFDQNLMYGVECESCANNWYYVRAGTSPLPATTTDLGLFQIAVNPAATFPANSTIGELWMAYEIEFSKPKSSPARFGYFHYHAYAIPTNIGSYTFGNTPTSITTSTVISYGALSTVTYIGGVLTFPFADVGDVYLVSFGYSAPAYATANLTAVGYTNPSLNGFNGVNVYGTGTFAMYPSITPINNNYNGSFIVVVTSTIAAPAVSVPTYTVTISALLGTIYADVTVVDIGNGFSGTQL
jgi:hypothetical protein